MDDVLWFASIVSKYQSEIDKDYALELLSLYRSGNPIDATIDFIMVMRGIGYPVQDLMRGELGQFIKTVIPDLVEFLPSELEVKPAISAQPQTQTTQPNPGPAATQLGVAQQVDSYDPAQLAQSVPQEPANHSANDDHVLHIPR